MKSFRDYYHIRLDEISNDIASDLENWRSDNQDQLPFDDLFDSQQANRIVIPFATSPEAVSILDKIKDSGLQIDFKQGVVYDPSKTSGSAVQPVYHRAQRLGKWILSKNGPFTPEEKNWWGHQGNALEALGIAQRADKYAIIVSRHPIDVVRMSDHDGWTSCHSPPNKYSKFRVRNQFRCGLPIICLC